jgi:accessory colonization factor AcfC
MKNIVDLYNHNINTVVSNDKNIELEVTYHLIKSVSVYKEIYKKLKDLSKEVTINQNIDIYYDNDLRLTKTFVNGINTNTDIIIKKKSLYNT